MPATWSRGDGLMILRKGINYAVYTEAPGKPGYPGLVSRREHHQPHKGGIKVKKETVTPKLLLGLLEAGDVDLVLWGEVEPVKLCDVGKTGFVLAKVWADQRETIELIPLNEIQEVSIRE